jgi:hypothetical protein
LTASEVPGIESVGEHKSSVAAKSGIREEIIACAFSLLPVVALDGNFYVGELGDNVMECKTDSNGKSAANRFGGHGDQVLNDPGRHSVDADLLNGPATV